MNILDENIIDNQRRQLKSWRIFVRQIGYEIGFLRHKSFRTKAHRMGAVVRVSHVGMAVWRLHAENEAFLAWN